MNLRIGTRDCPIRGCLSSEEVRCLQAIVNEVPAALLPLESLEVWHVLLPSVDGRAGGGGIPGYHHGVTFWDDQHNRARIQLALVGSCWEFVFAHELGHVVFWHLEHALFPDVVDCWREAASCEPAPTSYAETSLDEDFCDSFALELCGKLHLPRRRALLRTIHGLGSVRGVA